MSELTRQTQRNGAPTDPVSWEMIVRLKAEGFRVEMRATSETEMELIVKHLGNEESITLTFAEMHQALDELERSAREVERLG